MAEDELYVTIEKAFWPRGVVRSLAPALRELGDKHGGLVLAAIQTKGQIMVKGPIDKIEEVKPELQTLIEEFFPDAPTPEELQPGGGGGEAWGEEEAYQEEEQPPSGQEEPLPTPPPPPPAPAAAAPAAATVALEKKGPAAATTTTTGTATTTTKAAASPTSPVKKRAGKKKGRMSALEHGDVVAAKALAGAKAGELEATAPTRGRAVSSSSSPSSFAPPALIWQCVSQNNCFLRKNTRSFGPAGAARNFSADPANLLGKHSPRYVSLATDQALDVRPMKAGIKEGVRLVQTAVQVSRAQHQPSAFETASGLSKCRRKGVLRLERELNMKGYKRPMLRLTRAKYLKVLTSFKKPKAARPKKTKAKL